MWKKAKIELYQTNYVGGQVREHGYLFEGKKSGRFFHYHQNGVLSREVYYTEGEIQGRDIYWDSKGGLYKVVEYDYGRLLGEIPLDEYDGADFAAGKLEEIKAQAKKWVWKKYGNHENLYWS